MLGMSISCVALRSQAMLIPSISYVSCWSQVMLMFCRPPNCLQGAVQTGILRFLSEQKTIAAEEEITLSRTALAFMSYVNLDDQHEQGRLTKFRERLSGEVRMQTGEPFDIFQDRKDIAWGQQWQERINDSLNAVTFLIPIITPAFFKSTACRDELERFLKREEGLKRSDLILPVYYLACPVLSDKAKREHDKLAQIIAARQYADWRHLRFKPFDSKQVCEHLAKIAQQIVEALERSEAEASRLQPEKDSSTPASSSTFTNTASGTQSIAQGNHAIGTQINNYYASPPQESRPQPVPVVKSGPLTVVVDQYGNGNYRTINEALDSAKPGTRILVRPGLYREGIIIDKPVEIIGDGEQDNIVIKASYKSTVRFQADNGRVANLTLRQASSSGWYGVDISKGRLELEDCDISSKGWFCVVIHGSANPCLRHCRIHDGDECGVFVRGNGQGTLEDNEIFANTLNGVTIIEGGNPTLRRNRISHNSNVGISVHSGGGGTFEGNDLRGNTNGAWCIDPSCEANVQRRNNEE